MTEFKYTRPVEHTVRFDKWCTAEHSMWPNTLLALDGPEGALVREYLAHERDIPEHWPEAAKDYARDIIAKNRPLAGGEIRRQPSAAPLEGADPFTVAMHIHETYGKKGLR